MDPAHGLTTPVVVALMGVSVPLAIAVIHAAFKIGELSARVSELETWRKSVRGDMHEISEKMTELVTEMKSLRTLVDERTDRRAEKRIPS